MGKFSCYGCEKRHAGCHATCETYRKEKAAHEAEKEEERRAKKINDGLNAHMFECIAKCKGKKGRRWDGKEGRNIE